MHNYDHHIGDYTRDTVGLSMIEDGCYRRLLDQYYASELPLPKDKGEIYRMARASNGQERRIVDYVLSKFFVLERDGWHQHRADTEINKFQGKSEQAKLAADLRWKRERAKNGGGHDAGAHTDAPPNAHANADADAHPSADANASDPQCEKSNSAMPRARVPPSVLHPPQTGRSKATVAPPALPGWLPADLWAEWRRHRGKKLTAEAERRQLVTLEKLRQQGHDPPQVIARSIERGWSGLFPLDQNGEQNVSRATVAGEIFKGRSDDEPTDITAESQRVG